MCHDLSMMAILQSSMLLLLFAGSRGAGGEPTLPQRVYLRNSQRYGWVGLGIVLVGLVVYTSCSTCGEEPRLTAKEYLDFS